MSEFVCLIWRVEHGSAAFLRTPSDKTIMFDSGSSEGFSPASHLAQKYNLNAENNRLDQLIISHADNDHIRDLPYVYTFLKPRLMCRNKSVPEEILYPIGVSSLKDPLWTYKKMNEEYIYDAGPSDKFIPISNWGDVLIQVFSCSPGHLKDCPKDKLRNNLSSLSYVKFNNIEIVFPGDLEPLGWDALIENTSISNYVGKAEVRILIASHHGRKSGIRCDRDGEEKIYDRFLKMMNPSIVIISDKWGNETTDAEAYRPSCLGYDVYYSNEKKSETVKILTTKTNNCIGLHIIKGTPFVVAY